MSRRLSFFALAVCLLAVLSGLGVWVWQVSQTERESARELSVKVPARRVFLPNAQVVAIRLDAATQQRIGLRLAEAVGIQRQKQLHLLGFTILVPQRLTEIRSPWAGRLQAASEGDVPQIGQAIAKGQVLGEIVVSWSPTERMQLAGQLWEVRGLIGETEAETLFARNAVDRLRQVPASALAAKQALTAAGELAKFEARLNGLQARAEHLQDSLATESSPQRFPLTASLGGQLTSVPRRAGEFVAAGECIATIYDPSELWVRVLARPGQLIAIDFPQDARVTVSGFVGEPLAAKFLQATPLVDPGQQAREGIYCAANPDGRIPVGLQVQVELPAGPPFEALALPRSAVVQHDDRRLIYVQHGAEEFVKHVVQVADEDAELVYVLPDLPAAARVVCQGAQALLSEEFKESIQLVEEGGGSGSEQTPEVDEN